MAINYREDPSFKPEYVYSGDRCDAAKAPFPVAVFGIGEPPPFLGVGRVVGTVEAGFGQPNPVIEVEDVADGQTYTLRGIESWWTHPIPEEIADQLADGSLKADSVRRYLDTLRAEDELSDAADNAWLEDHGIDPESETS